MRSTLDFALLLPVLREDLDDAIQLCRDGQHVAFGCREWLFFEELDARRASEPVLALVCGTRDELPATKTIAKAWYVGHVRSDEEKWEDAKQGRRPPLAAHRPEDGPDYWPVFYHLRDLDWLPSPVPVREFVSLVTGARLKAAPPRRPLLIQRPDGMFAVGSGGVSS